MLCLPPGHIVTGCDARQLLGHVLAWRRSIAFSPLQMYRMDTAVGRTKRPEGSQSEERSHSTA